MVPYADLNALNQPGDLNQITNNLVSTLAVLSAQSSGGPKLLGVDDTGALKVAARMNAVTRLTAPLAGGATIAQVLDTSQFFAGDHVSLITNGTPSSDCTDIVVKQIDSPTQIEFAATCGSVSFNPGDYLVGEQVVNVRQIFEAVDVSDRSNRALGNVNINSLVAGRSAGIFGASATGAQSLTAGVNNANQAYLGVWAVNDPPSIYFASNFGVGATPSVSIPPLSGLSIDLLHWSTVISNVSGAASSVIFVTVTTTGTGGHTMWVEHLGVPNVVGSTAEVPNNPVRIVSAPGQGMTVAWTAAVPAGYGADINLAYTYH